MDVFDLRGRLVEDYAPSARIFIRFQEFLTYVGGHPLGRCGSRMRQRVVCR